MAKQKEPRDKRESGMTGPGEEAETKAIESWLRITDKPLAKEKRDRQDPEPREDE